MKPTKYFQPHLPCVLSSKLLNWFAPYFKQALLHVSLFPPHKVFSCHTAQVGRFSPVRTVVDTFGEGFSVQNLTGMVSTFGCDNLNTSRSLLKVLHFTHTLFEGKLHFSQNIVRWLFNISGCVKEHRMGPDTDPAKCVSLTCRVFFCIKE